MLHDLNTMASALERIPLPASSFEQTSSIPLAIAGAFVVGLITWLTTQNWVTTIIAALIVGYLLLGVRIIRPTHRVLVEFLGKYQKSGFPETVCSEYHGEDGQCDTTGDHHGR
jgi:hypothetical protein